MKKITFLYIIVLVAIVLNSCKKDDTEPSSNKQTNVFNLSKAYGAMTDQDGNVYKTITIGTQIWMAENLRTTKYRDGSPIKDGTGNNWSFSEIGAYCNYNNTKGIDTISTYGRLYNWYAVSDIHNLAPIGWHVPTDTEWSILTDYLGGEELAGGKLKEGGTTHWEIPNLNATNESGYTALPGGYRTGSGAFSEIGIYGYWWSSTGGNTGIVYRYMYYYDGSLSKYLFNKEDGFSVRCVMD